MGQSLSRITHRGFSSSPKADAAKAQRRHAYEDARVDHFDPQKKVRLRFQKDTLTVSLRGRVQTACGFCLREEVIIPTAAYPLIATENFANVQAFSDDGYAAVLDDTRLMKDGFFRVWPVARLEREVQQHNDLRVGDDVYYVWLGTGPHVGKVKVLGHKGSLFVGNSSTDGRAKVEREDAHKLVSTFDGFVPNDHAFLGTDYVQVVCLAEDGTGVVIPRGVDRDTWPRQVPNINKLEKLVSSLDGFTPGDIVRKGDNAVCEVLQIGDRGNARVAYTDRHSGKSTTGIFPLTALVHEPSLNSR